MVSEYSRTLRVTSEAMEKALASDPSPILDHGLIRVVDYMGDDSSIVQAARVSYGKGTKKVSEDKALIRYLMRHRHTTPFEMCELKLHIKMPIFVARQWIRHRMASINEYSARYSVLDKEFYVPQIENLRPQSRSNKQGRSDESLSLSEANEVLELIKSDSLRCYSGYQKMMNVDDQGNSLCSENKGIARELARINLSLNYYTQFYWKIDLHNLMHFVALRAEGHSQYEIRVYAEHIMEKILRPWVPLSYEAFLDYRYHSYHASRGVMRVMKDVFLLGKKVTYQDSNLSKREWDEFMEALEEA